MNSWKGIGLIIILLILVIGFLSSKKKGLKKCLSCGYVGKDKGKNCPICGKGFRQDREIFKEGGDYS